MIVMKINDLRALPNETLKSRLNELTLNLSIEKRKVASTGVASKKIKLREMRRTIAQINTLLKERGVQN